MHDGRFANIREVMQHYQKHIEEVDQLNNFDGLSPKYRQSRDSITNEPIIKLSNYDVENVERLLDVRKYTTIIKNKAWSDPFQDTTFSWDRFIK